MVDIVIAVAMFWHLAAVTKRLNSSLFGEINHTFHCKKKKFS